MKPDHEIAVNESFQVELVSNPTTGYAWKWTNKQSISIVDTFDHKFIPDSPDLIGGGGKEIWYFKGFKSGIDIIKMDYCRLWDLTSTVNSINIIVKVK